MEEEGGLRHDLGAGDRGLGVAWRWRSVVAASGLSVRERESEAGGEIGSGEKEATAMEWEGIGFGWLGCPGGWGFFFFLSLLFCNFCFIFFQGQKCPVDAQKTVNAI